MNQGDESVWRSPWCWGGICLCCLCFTMLPLFVCDAQCRSVSCGSTTFPIPFSVQVVTMVLSSVTHSARASFFLNSWATDAMEAAGLQTFGVPTTVDSVASPPGFGDMAEGHVWTCPCVCRYALGWTKVSCPNRMPR